MLSDRLLTVSLTALAISANPALSAAQSFIPAEDLAQFLVQNLDLSTFRSSLGPRRSQTQRTFAALGIVPTQVKDDTVVLEDDAWYYSLHILRRADINRDGLEDLELCFTDHAKQGSFSTKKALLVTRYSASSLAVALNFEVTGCEALAR